jgi:uncharacterized repeat protein (TIGR01451 family)
MISTHSRGQRKTALTAVMAGTLGLAAVILAPSPAAFAESAESPTGMVTVSVPSPVFAGVPSTYTVTFTNTTSSATTSVVAEGELPAGMTLKNITNCARLGGNQTTSILCSMANLAPGASESATFSFLAGAVGTYDIPFGVSALVPVAGAPGVSLGVGDSVALTVNAQPGPADLQVTGSVNNGSPPVGSAFTYTFQVKNNGPLPSSGVTFDDSLPTAINIGGTLAVDAGACAADALSNHVHCDIGNLAVGQQSTISFAATPTATGVFGNTASVAMTGPDTHPANNDVTVTVQPK